MIGKRPIYKLTASQCLKFVWPQSDTSQAELLRLLNQSGYRSIPFNFTTFFQFYKSFIHQCFHFASTAVEYVQSKLHFHQQSMQQVQSYTMITKQFCASI